LIATVDHHCTASIGVVMLAKHNASQTDAMKWADAAMYQAKDGGRNRVQFYEKYASRPQTTVAAGNHPTQGLPVTHLAQNDERQGACHCLQVSEAPRNNTLQQSEAFKNIILNSLDAEIAVVDREGVILVVNDRWEQFARENGVEPGKSAPNTGVGTNYFAVCGGDSASCCDDTLDARAGLQAVLDGRLASFGLDYPCDSPTQQRWFAMTSCPWVKAREMVLLSRIRTSPSASRLKRSCALLPASLAMRMKASPSPMPSASSLKSTRRLAASLATAAKKHWAKTPVSSIPVGRTRRSTGPCGAA
jgi:hypothetical protein